MCVAIPMKIWNNTRIEIKLEEQERLLLQARMEALQSQINPHFLFNTLNSISSLVRFDPDMARDMIVKLANILRRLLRKGDAFVPLREEFEFIDDYLDIEVVRFGRDKLHVVKELDPASLESMVPSMLLQPLVENSHQARTGAARSKAAASTCAAASAGGMLDREVEDDGVGMGAARAGAAERPRRQRHRHGQCRRAAEGALWRYGQMMIDEQLRRRHAACRSAAAGPAPIEIEARSRRPTYDARSSTPR